MQSIFKKLNNVSMKYLILVVCLSLIPCFLSIVQSSKFNYEITNFPYNSLTPCMIANCILCQDNMAYTCNICQQGKSCCSQYCKTCSSINPTICQQCQTNYVYNQSSKSCMLKNSCQQQQCENCLKNIQQCQFCSVRSVLNPFTLTCQPCPQNCMLCNISLQCSSCDSQFFLQDQTCKRCDQNCYLCQNSSTTCIQCAPSMYLFNFTCFKCLEDCQECKGKDQCTRCIENHYFVNETKTCEPCGQYCIACTSVNNCLQCYQNYFLNENNGFCYSCEEIIPNCQICGQIPDQNESKNETLRNQSNIANISIIANVRCSKCHPGYLLINYTQCKPCIQHCTICNDLQKCQQCDTSYVYSPQKNKCVPCSIANCYICLSTTVCSTCVQAYFWNNISHPEFPLCDRCRTGCRSCGINYCTSCEMGYYFVNETKMCMKCNSECLQCAYRADYCSLCSSGFYPSPTSFKCLKCENNCLKCLSKDCCTQCAVGYRNVNKTCIKCRIQNCGYCTVDQNSKQTCLQCTLQNILVNNSCTPCTEGCQDCLIDFKCFSCIKGYYLYQNTNTCKKCQQNCVSCVVDGNWHVNCDQCQTGFYIDQNYHCQPCKVQNCQGCEGDTCFRCAKGFYLDNDIDANISQCKKCKQSCTGCLDKQNCYQCSAGFYLKNYSCQKCPEGCQTCNNYETCLLCSQSYRLDQNSKTCQACKTTNCVNCSENINSCNQCLSGFTLENVTQLNEGKNTQNLTSLCFKCGQNLLSGCKSCSSSISCLQCSEGYNLNENKLCQPQNQKIWPYVLVICLLSTIILIYAGIKLKKKMNGKSFSEILKIGKKKSADTEDYHRLEELSIN